MKSQPSMKIRFGEIEGKDSEFQPKTTNSFGDMRK
jgi:hypothetical protein